MRISYWSSDVCSFRSNGARRAVIDVAVPIAARNPTRVKFESSQLQGFVIPCHTASITLTYNECTSRLVHPRQPSRQQRFQHASQPPSVRRMPGCRCNGCALCRSEEHTSELQSLMRISYAVFCLKKKNTTHTI